MKVMHALLGLALIASTWTYADETKANPSYDELMKTGHEKNGKKDTEGALAAFHEALKAAPDRSKAARARNQIASIIAQKDSAMARELWEQSLIGKSVEDGAKAEAQYLIGHSWIGEGNWPEARKAFAKFMGMKGVWPYALSEARMIVGAGLVEEKKFDDARLILRKCVDAKDGVDWHKRDAQMSIAKSYALEGNKPLAKAALEKLLKMPAMNDGTKKQAEDLLETLK